ncbi:MAG TPA: nucleotide exchange factor GrpE [Candidatus Binatia bacterium]|jgi:molecular chaperone GrpE|nr:nucleotide exchange factor GrpE [Candidatus Binatia bacterium]
MNDEKDKEFNREDGEEGVDDLENLRRQLEEKEAEAREIQDRLLRQAADLENYKKRAARDKADSIRYANENLVKDLLPVLDNLERALGYAQGGGNGKPLLEGIDMVLKNFLEVLGRHGVTPVSAVGERFDPSKHEAVAQVESPEHEPNVVVDEYRKGYYLLDRLLRPAQVTVAKSVERKN